MTSEPVNRSGNSNHPPLSRRFQEISAPTTGVDPTRRISEVISRLMARMGLEQDLWLSELTNEWPGLVGEVVARHTRPGQLIGRTLVVFVDSPAWLNELHRYGRAEMLANLQKRFGMERIQAVRLRPDPDVGRQQRHPDSI
ncbi:MAG: DUF721 domain-containing protein [Kiritimatiellae bacterium]|nr:DUF721 domain-containing protein [Kiritimatiellia bacterium]